MPVHPTGRKMPYTCEMCDDHQLKPPAYLWIPDAKKISGSKDLRICRKCAIREHGRRNSTPLNEMTRMEDKEDG